MKVVFVHDHKFRCVNNAFYSPGGLSNEVLERYVSYFGNVTVIGRIINENRVALTYSKIASPNIRITSSNDLKSEIESCDAVIARMPSNNGLKAIHLAKKTNKPYLVEVVGCAFDSLWHHSFKGKICAVPFYFFNRHAIKDAPYALYVTKHFLQNRYPNNGCRIGMSDVALKFTNEDILTKRLKKYEKINRTFILGTAGAIDVTYKGQEYVIKAIPEIEKKIGIPLIYKIAGGGSKSRLLGIAKECGVEDKIVFEGVLSRNEIFDWFDDLDVYIQSSTVEGLSRAVIEAMSRGLPCLAVNCGGNPELVDEKYLLDKKNITNQIVSHFCELFNTKELQKQSVINFKKANSDFNVEQLNSKRAKFYSDFVNYVRKF